MKLFGKKKSGLTAYEAEEEEEPFLTAIEAYELSLKQRKICAEKDRQREIKGIEDNIRYEISKGRTEVRTCSHDDETLDNFMKKGYKVFRHTCENFYDYHTINWGNPGEEDEH